MKISRLIVDLLIAGLTATACKTVVEVPDGPGDAGEPDQEDDGGVDFVVCGGEVCDQVPDPWCEDERNLLVWNGTPGSCSKDGCSYAVVRRTCAHRCVDGDCVDEVETDTAEEPDSDSAAVASDTGSETHAADSDTDANDAGDGGETDAGSEDPGIQ